MHYKKFQNQVNFLITFLFLFGISSSTFSKDFDDSEIQDISYPDWFLDDSFKDLNDDLANAIANGKKGLMIMFTTQGCSYCKMFLKVSLGNPRIADLVQRNFDTMGLEIFDDTEMTHPDGTPMLVKEFAIKEGAGIAPTLLFFGSNGKKMFSLVGYKSPEHFENIISFVENRKPNEKFRDYLRRKSINVVEKSDYKLKDDPFFLPASALSERQQAEHQQAAPQKPLLVLLEANNCLECENFHNDVLALPEIREQLEKFDVVRLDRNDSITSLTTPTGETVTPQQWYTSQELTQLPTLLFYSTDNQLILKTDSIVKRQRMLNSMGLVLDKAYEKGWNYQRYARNKGIERAMKKQSNQ